MPEVLHVGHTQATCNGVAWCGKAERGRCCAAARLPEGAMTAVSWKRSKLRNFFFIEAVRHYDYLFQVHAVAATTAGATDEASEVV